MKRWTGLVVPLVPLPLPLLLPLLFVACSDPPLGAHPSTGSSSGEPPVVIHDAGPDASPDAGPDASADGGPDAGQEPDLGATVVEGGVLFRLWAPHATSVAVVGDFPGSPASMIAEPDGLFRALVPSAHAGSLYHFTLDTPTGLLDRLDPRCREIALGATDCLVIDPSAYAWKSAPLTRPARHAVVVYELHVGGFTTAPGGTQGTLASARDKLGELADLGVNVVELMP
ncbi:MAG: hypothetical protein ABI193_17820, partial [Minicystis sp.]